MSKKMLFCVCCSFLAIILFACMFVGCKEENKDKEDVKPQNIKGSLAMFSDTETRTFDVNDCTFDITYGWLEGTEIDAFDWPITFELYVETNSPDSKIVIHEIPDFYSDEYKVYVEVDDNGYGHYVYNHKETITIPASVFENNSGTVMVRSHGFVDESFSPGGGFLMFDYQKIDDDTINIVFTYESRF